MSTSESVSDGQSDKVADSTSDAFLLMGRRKAMIQIQLQLRIASYY